ncbi:hypothetical protein SLE2022_091390 [Rubroshorea leprosula]
MGRSPCCDDSNLKKGPWTPEEDQKLVDYINKNGLGSWKALPKLACLNRCGKSCRLRWTNYLRPDIKRGKFSEDEERLIINLHSVLGNRWSRISAHLPGRTDNEIKNFWNTHIRKKLLQMGIDPNTHKPRTDLNHLLSFSQLLCAPQIGNLLNLNSWDTALKLQADHAVQLAKLKLLLQVINSNTVLLPYTETTPAAALLGSQNHYQFEGLGNGISSTPGPTPLPPLNESQGFENSWASLDVHDKGLSGYFDVETGNSLPALVSGSPETSGIDNNQVETEANTNNSSIFKTWDKLMDDEASASYWKDILAMTSPLPSSPISW